MTSRSLYLVSTCLLAVGLSGCPVTDDYYLLSDDGTGVSGKSNAAGTTSASAGQSTSGSSHDGGKSAQAGSSMGGASAAGTHGSPS